MKLTVKLEYALRAMACLAARSGSDEVRCIDDIANEEAIPANYLVQILGELRNGGLVASRRGKQGGYLLAKKPSEIALGDVIRLVQGDLLSPAGPVSGQSGRQVQRAWADLQSALADRAASITLADLVSPVDEKMYFI